MSGTEQRAYRSQSRRSTWHTESRSFPRSHQSGMRLNHNKQLSFETSGFSTWVMALLFLTLMFRSSAQRRHQLIPPVWFWGEKVDSCKFNFRVWGVQLVTVILTKCCLKYWREGHCSLSHSATSWGLFSLHEELCQLLQFQTFPVEESCLYHFLE